MGLVDLMGLALLQPTPSSFFSRGRRIKGLRSQGSRRVDALNLHGADSVAVFCGGLLACPGRALNRCSKLGDFNLKCASMGEA